MAPAVQSRDSVAGQCLANGLHHSEHLCLYHHTRPDCFAGGTSLVAREQVRPPSADSRGDGRARHAGRVAPAQQHLLRRALRGWLGRQVSRCAMALTSGVNNRSA